MADLRSDSPFCRRIVRSFLDFLQSVQPAPGVDMEGLEVVRECLEQVFKLNLPSTDVGIQPGLLTDLFLREAGGECKLKSILDPASTKNTSTTISTSKQNEDSSDLKASNAEDQVGLPHVTGGDTKDELFGKLYSALDKINFFKTSADGVEDPVQLAKATQYFSDALKEMEKSEGQIISLSSLAETFKMRGNDFMQSKLYSEAIELYTCAIVLCEKNEKNAIYYCNRAAAFTQIDKYTEAVDDCLKSIEINPNYSKAYSRLGLAYYAQGNYTEALTKGFLKALRLDPNNDFVKENIKVSQQKLMEQYQREQYQQTEDGQHTGPSHWHESNTQPSGSTHHRFSFNASNPTASGSTNHRFSFNASDPAGLADLFRTMASGGPQSDPTRPTSNSEDLNEPEIRMDANVDIGGVPEQLSDALRSIMGRISSQHGFPQDAPRGSD